MPILIENICARQSFDFDKNVAFEIEVVLNNGVGVILPFPLEFLYSKSNNSKDEYDFLSVIKKSIFNINNVISKELIGFSSFEQSLVDCTLCELDKTDNFSNLGFEAVFGVSLAILEASAKAKGMELFQYIGGINVKKVPLPIINLFNSNSKINNIYPCKEFMIFSKEYHSSFMAFSILSKIYNSFSKLSKNQEIADFDFKRGDFAEISILNLIMESIQKTKFSFDDVKIALNIASDDFYSQDFYHIHDKKYSNADMIGYYTYLYNKFPIGYLEDALSKYDTKAWQVLLDMIDENIMVVGNSLFESNYRLLKNKFANSVLIKPNKIGTVSQIVSCVNLAKKLGYCVIMPCLNIDSKNSPIVDLAVGLGCDYIKIKSIIKDEKILKQNRLLEIEEKIRKCTRFLQYWF